MLKRVLIALLALLALPLQAAEIRDLRLWRAPDHTRVVFDLSGPVEHRIFALANPYRVVVDIDGATLKTSLDKLDLQGSPIVGLRHAAKPNSQLRVVFDLGAEVQPRSFLLAASGELHDRLVLDFYDQQQRPQVVKRATDIAAKQRDVIIAIDAGHGGEDPGAIGPGRLREKDVVLAIASELKALFDAQPGYKAVMVRGGDYYVGLRKRRDLARAAQADLMLSVHADAFKNANASGTSVYALSKRGATSASAGFLAQRENSADLVGGVSLSDKDDVLAGVLTDLSMTASLEASLSIGDRVLSEMGKFAKLHSRRVEQAAFAVLKSPDIPSILVETGFISNPGEARKLKTRSYQRRMARAIFNGVDDYFRASPPPDTYLAALKRGELRPRQHVIVSGDTLSEIAKRYNVSVSALRRENGLSGSTIRVGQTLLIPTT